METLDTIKKSLLERIEPCKVNMFRERIGVPFLQGRLSVEVGRVMLDLGIVKTHKPTELKKLLSTSPVVDKVWFDIQGVVSEEKGKAQV